MIRRDSLGVLAVLLLGAVACGGADTAGSDSDEQTTEVDVAPEASGSEDLGAEESAERDAEEEADEAEEGRDLGTVLAEATFRLCEEAPAELYCRSR